MSPNNALSTFFNVDAHKEWTDPLLGTALALPSTYRSYKLKGELYIEYLQNGSTNAKQGEVAAGIPGKNHVVFQVPFATAYELRIDNKIVTVRGARISMDLTDEDVDNIDKDRLESEYKNKRLLDDYFPGTLYVKLLKYEGKSTAANKVTKFNNLNLANLGDFVDFIKGKKLHEMSFIGYGEAWKGCRHFITQTFLQLRTAGKVSATDQEGQTLKDNITKVHHKDSRNHVKLVDRGKFLSYVAIYPRDIVDAYEVEDQAV
jgi:hypothetical protein